jgi:hypothetical protein
MEMGMATKRVTYTNQLDGQRRVLVGGLSQEAAEAVAASWGNPRRKNFYLGPVEIEDCDGTPDGDVISRPTPTATK